MNDKIIDELMTSIGGEITSDKDGKFWLFYAGEMVGEIEPFLRKRGDVVTVGIDVSVSHPKLSEVATAIMGEKRGTRQNFEWHQRKEDISGQNDPVAELKHVVNREIEHLRSLRIQSIIDALASIRPDSPSMKQIFHLAALAFKGNVIHLTEYLDAMRRGKRYNFVPMINQKMLERAVNAAVQRLPN